MEITQAIVQSFLDKFRRGYCAIDEGDIKVSFTNRFGFNSITASSWESLLSRCVDRHDEIEVSWLKKNGIILD